MSSRRSTNLKKNRSNVKSPFFTASLVVETSLNIRKERNVQVAITVRVETMIRKREKDIENIEIYYFTGLKNVSRKTAWKFKFRVRFFFHRTTPLSQQLLSYANSHIAISRCELKTSVSSVSLSRKLL